MSEYVALRVPISLLHQKVYSTSHRLSAWTGGAVDKEGKPIGPKEESASGPVYEDVRRKIVIPKNQVVSRLPKSVFTLDPYLRRFYYLVDESSGVLVCRYCAELVHTVEERSDHFGCYAQINKALVQLADAYKCAICDEMVYNSEKIRQRYSGVPICSDECMWSWERMNPESLDDELTLVRKSLGEETK